MLILATMAALTGAPPPVFGDFDRDGKLDKAEITKDRRGRIVVVVVRGADGRRIVIDTAIERGDLAGMFLIMKSRGRQATWCGKIDSRHCRRRFVVIRGDVLAFGDKESSEAVAIWTGKIFDIEWLSD